MPGLLDDLKAHPIWLLWKEEPNADPNKKRRKVPYYAMGSRRAGALDGPDDRAQLRTFDEVAAVFEREAGTYTGIGIALGPDGSGGYVQGIDLDDIQHKGLSDIANRWVRGDFSGMGYVEASPSGEGLHILGYGRHFDSLGPNASGIEAYAGARFFTFTGNCVRANGACCPTDLADFVESELAPRHKPRNSSFDAEASGTFIDPCTVTDLRSALRHLRADDRDLWIRMGMALRELGEVGRGMWLDWSATSDKFDPHVASGTWDSFKPNATCYQAVFAEAQRQGWVNPASNAARSGTSGFSKFGFRESQGEDWPDPIPMPNSLLPVATFDLTLLPDPFRPWIADIAERMQVPPEFVAVPAMVGAGSVIGNQIGIRPMCEDDWQVVPNLWGCIVGRPGVLKSPSVSAALAPVHRLEAEANEAFRREYAAWEATAFVFRGVGSLIIPLSPVTMAGCH